MIMRCRLLVSLMTNFLEEMSTPAFDLSKYAVELAHTKSETSYDDLAVEDADRKLWQEFLENGSRVLSPYGINLEHELLKHDIMCAMAQGGKTSLLKPLHVGSKPAGAYVAVSGRMRWLGRLLGESLRSGFVALRLNYPTLPMISAQECDESEKNEETIESQAEDSKDEFECCFNERYCFPDDPNIECPHSSRISIVEAEILRINETLKKFEKLQIGVDQEFVKLYTGPFPPNFDEERIRKGFSGKLFEVCPFFSCMSMFLGFNLSRVEVVTARFGRKIAFVTLQKTLADDLIKKYNGKSCSFGVLKVELKTSPKRKSE